MPAMRKFRAPDFDVVDARLSYKMDELTAQARTVRTHLSRLSALATARCTREVSENRRMRGLALSPSRAVLYLHAFIRHRFRAQRPRSGQCRGSGDPRSGQPLRLQRHGREIRV